MHYNLFRYYDPHIGRFTQQDPIGLAGGDNLYQFAANAQGHIDVLGLSATLNDFEGEVINPLPSWNKESKGSLGSRGTVMVGGVVLGTVGYQGPKTSRYGIHGTHTGSGEMHYILFVVQ